MRARVCYVNGLLAVLVVLSTGLEAAGVDTRVVDAAKAGDIAVVRQLLQQQVDVNAPQPDGATALHWAAYADDLKMADLLLSAGSSVDVVNDYGVPPLSLAARNGSAAMVEKLLEAGANPNAALPTGETILMTAAQAGSTASVETLLARGAAVNATEAVMGQTALIWAIWQGHMDVVQKLVDAGADVEATSTSGFTPLMFAAREGSIEAARLLLSRGTNTNAVAKDGVSALHVAVVRGHVRFAKLLLEHGASPNADAPGFTPLHWAAGTWETVHSHDYIFNEVAVVQVEEWRTLAGIPSHEAKLDLIKALLEKGANVNVRTSKAPPRFGFSLFKAPLAIGSTPFYLASLASDTPTMRLLLANGADPMIGALDNSTPLMVAAGLARVDNETRIPEVRALEAVKLALMVGNSIHEANGAGNTALHAATMAGLDTVVQYLVESGAQINAKNKKGETPLKIANGFEDSLLMYTRPSTAVVLQKLGASLD